MTITRYRAKSLKAAISRARADIGPEARVIHVRQLEEGNERVEIIAAVDGVEDTGLETKDRATANMKTEVDTPLISFPNTKAKGNWGLNLV